MLRGSQRAPPAGEGGASSMLRGSQRAPPANGTQRSPPVPLQGQHVEISAPVAARVVTRRGPGPSETLDLDALPPEVIAIFKAAGITRKDLRDPATAEFAFKFVKAHLDQLEATAPVISGPEVVAPATAVSRPAPPAVRPLASAVPCGRCGASNVVGFTVCVRCNDSPQQAKPRPTQPRRATITLTRDSGAATTPAPAPSTPVVAPRVSPRSNGFPAPAARPEGGTSSLSVPSPIPRHRAEVSPRSSPSKSVSDADSYVSPALEKRSPRGAVGGVVAVASPLVNRARVSPRPMSEIHTPSPEPTLRNSGGRGRPASEVMSQVPTPAARRTAAAPSPPPRAATPVPPARRVSPRPEVATAVVAVDAVDEDEIVIGGGGDDSMATVADELPVPPVAEEVVDDEFGYVDLTNSAPARFVSVPDVSMLPPPNPLSLPPPPVLPTDVIAAFQAPPAAKSVIPDAPPPPPPPAASITPRRGGLDDEEKSQQASPSPMAADIGEAIRNTRRSQLLKPVQLENLRKELSASAGLASALADALGKMRAAIKDDDAKDDDDNPVDDDDW